MTKSPEAPRRSKWAWFVSLRKNTLAVVGAVGLVVGAVLGIIQLVGWLSSVGEDPIRVNYNYVNYPAEGVIVGEFDPGADPRRYLRDERIAASYPYVYAEVTSQAEQEAVTLPPYLVVEVTEARPMPEESKYVVYPAGVGGAQLRHFTATLSPEREGIFYAPQWTPETTLKPASPGYTHAHLTRGGAAWLLVGFITRRSRVQMSLQQTVGSQVPGPRRTITAAVPPLK